MCRSRISRLRRQRRARLPVADGSPCLAHRREIEFFRLEQLGRGGEMVLASAKLAVPRKPCQKSNMRPPIERCEFQVRDSAGQRLAALLHQVECPWIVINAPFGPGMVVEAALFT